jgi:methionyl-tRNA formyltransferase
MPQPEGHPINLIIAVSFGLFVPPRLLRAAKYGGLNVHPSLLPDLRGPAPIQHAILLGRPRTGTTLQTLSEETFDGGIVLDQKALGITPDDTFSTLHERLKDVSGTLLIHGIRNKLYVPPLLPQGWTPTPKERAHLAHAPKITTEDRRLRWDSPNNTAAYIARQNRALGPLWTTIPNLKKPGQTIRILLDDITQEPPFKKQRHHRAHGELGCRQMAFGPEEAALWVTPGEDESAVRIGMPTSNQSVEFIRVGKIKVEGGVWNPAWQAFSPHWHLD